MRHRVFSEKVLDIFDDPFPSSINAANASRDSSPHDLASQIFNASARRATDLRLFEVTLKKRLLATSCPCRFRNFRQRVVSGDFDSRLERLHLFKDHEICSDSYFCILFASDFFLCIFYITRYKDSKPQMVVMTKRRDVNAGETGAYAHRSQNGFFL